MNGTVEEWFAKAEADYLTASRELHAPSSPNYDAVCFHAQQSIEKQMKGLLIHCGITPPRTHDLAVLDELLEGACPGWSWPIEELRMLSHAAVSFRYPGESADQEEAALALARCEAIRGKLLSLLGE